MNLTSLRKWMEDRKIEVVGVEDGKLIVSAPTGTMADSVLSVLLTHKKQLIADYKEASTPKIMFSTGEQTRLLYNVVFIGLPISQLAFFLLAYCFAFGNNLRAV